jgi:hypothetical protein
MACMSGCFIQPSPTVGICVLNSVHMRFGEIVCSLAQFMDGPVLDLKINVLCAFLYYFCVWTLHNLGQSSETNSLYTYVHSLPKI